MRFSIKSLARNMNIYNPLARLKDNISRYSDIFKAQNRKLINLLNKYEKAEFETWLFNAKII